MVVRVLGTRRTKSLIVGRPRTVRGIEDKNNPDNYPTLIRFLEATGRIKHTSSAVMLKARNLYLRGMSSSLVVSEMKKSGHVIEKGMVDRWALIFSWDEERDRRLFEQFRKVSGIDRMYGKNVGERHDRIAASIEQVAERMLQKQANGEADITPQDLGRLTSVIKGTQDIRRVARGESDVKKSEDKRTVDINVNMPASLDKLASALVDSYHRPKLKAAVTKTIAVGTEGVIGSDTEYETTDR